jgi:NDP-sugar pyrophosphorylase family protein
LEAAQLILASTKQSLVGEIYPQWLKENRLIKGVIKPLFYDDLGTQARIFHNNMAILKGAAFEQVDIFEGLTPVFNAQGIFLGHGSVVADSAKLTAPLIVRSHARIGAHAQVGPNVVIGEACLVGDHARISNSVVLSETHIEKDEILDCMMALRSARVLVRAKF